MQANYWVHGPNALWPTQPKFCSAPMRHGPVSKISRSAPLWTPSYAQSLARAWGQPVP